MKLLGFALALLAPIAFASPLPDFPFVNATGRAEIKIAPDIGEIALTVEAFGVDAAETVRVVQERSAEILKKMEAIGVAKEDVLASQVDKEYTELDEDELSWSVGARKSRKDLSGGMGYYVSRDIEIALRDLSKYGDVMAPVLDMSNVSIDYTTFDVANRKDREDELLKKACEDAQKQAEYMADGFGVELGLVRGIYREGLHDFGFDSYRSGYRVTIDGLSALHTIEEMRVPSSITLTAEVTAVFEIHPNRD